MKKYYLLYILVFMFTSIYAQKNRSIPGYLNQRNTLSFGIRSYAVLNDENFIKNALQPAFEISYDRVLNRRSTISFSFGTQSYKVLNGVSLSNFGSSSNNLEIIYNNTETRLYPNTNNGYLQFSNTHINISKTYFISSRGAIAPFGKYFKMGLTSYFYKIKKDELEYRGYISPNNIAVKNPENNFVTQQLYAINLELGNRTFFGKHLFFNKAISFNLPFNFWSVGQYRQYNNMTTYNETFLTRYLSGMQTININLAVGYAF